MCLHFRTKLSLIVTILVSISVQASYSFDSVLDTTRETVKWKFTGGYIYAHTLKDIQDLTPLLFQTAVSNDPSPSKEREERQGIWFTKYTPDGKNQYNMSYSLTHLLFVQAWVSYLAHPAVPLVIKSRGDKELGRFWSDGKSWCDAVVNMNYNNYFEAEVNTTKFGHYAMVDKIVLGIMGNITALRKRTINPCLTISLVPPEEEKKIDVEIKNTNEIRLTSDQGPSDLNETITTSATPTKSSPEMPTTEKPIRTFQTDHGGAKCNCICTCAKPTNTTSTTAATPII